MQIDKAAYDNLEQLFRIEVERDRARIIERVVQGWGVYLPCAEPKSQVDYIIVGMEPSFGWAKDIEDAEQKIREGAHNYAWPDNEKEPVSLFMLAIRQFLCKQEQTYHLTDISKGAMPGRLADLDRDRRYEEWYPLLLKEIEIVGKPSAPVIAVGKKVETFLKKRDLKGKTDNPFTPCGITHVRPARTTRWRQKRTARDFKRSRNRTSSRVALGHQTCPFQ